MAVSNNFVENAFLRHEITLFFDDKRAGLPEFDIVAYLRASFILNGQIINFLFESFDNRFGCFKFGKIANGVQVVNIHKRSK